MIYEIFENFNIENGFNCQGCLLSIIYQIKILALCVFILVFCVRDCSGSKSPLTKLSRLDIQNELKSTQRQLWEQMILPSIMENEDYELPSDQDSIDFVERIKKVLEDSKEMQRNLNSGIRKNMKRFGDEKRFVVNSPVADIVKGYPEIDLKWMFGDKEVVTPRAASNHLFHSWKKWREDVKADLKKDLLEDVEFGKKYVAQRQVCYA